MGDRSYLAWPFFEDRHRDLAGRLAAYAPSLREMAEDEHDVDQTCRSLVRRLGEDGWLKLCTGDGTGRPARGGPDGDGSGR